MKWEWSYNTLPFLPVSHSMQCRNIAVADGIGVINYKKDNSREMTSGRQDTEMQVKWTQTCSSGSKAKPLKPKVANSFNLIYIFKFYTDKHCNLHNQSLDSSCRNRIILLDKENQQPCVNTSQQQQQQPITLSFHWFLSFKILISNCSQIQSFQIDLYPLQIQIPP